jgi:hypothetical protein
MKLTAPTQLVWIITTILGGLAIVGYFVAIPFFSPNGFWILAVAFIVLTLATLLKGL